MFGLGSGISPCGRCGFLFFFFLFYGLQASLNNGQKITVHTAGYARKTAFFLMEIELIQIYNKES